MEQTTQFIKVVTTKMVTPLMGSCDGCCFYDNGVCKAAKLDLVCWDKDNSYIFKMEKTDE